jgi:hypothetical protein
VFHSLMASIHWCSVCDEKDLVGGTGGAALLGLLLHGE